MIRAVLFDLDDTLYPEESFVRSAFAAAADELARRGAVADPTEAARLFVDLHLREGRDGVFDKAIEQLGLDAGLLPVLVSAFRSHEPNRLSFFEDVLPLLERLRSDVALGVVTDGWLTVQQRKATALGLHEHVDAVMFSDELGRERWKPHPAPFLACLERLGNIQPSEAVYVGDNPERDIAGARAANIRPIWLRRRGAYFADSVVGSDVREVADFEQLGRILEQEMGVHR